MRGARASCAVVLAALATSGCSLVAVRPPPPSPPPPGTPLECTQSRVAPGLDTAGAIVTPVVGLAALGICAFVQTQQSWASEPQDLRCGTFLWATLGITAAYAGSAIYGFHETGVCRSLAARTAVEEAPPSRPLPPELAPVPRAAPSDPAAR